MLLVGMDFLHCRLEDRDIHFNFLIVIIKAYPKKFRTNGSLGAVSMHRSVRAYLNLAVAMGGYGIGEDGVGWDRNSAYLMGFRSIVYLM